MSEIRVNPTRMELKNLQKRYDTARRGHKLLKDKRDELMRQFLALVREDKELRMRVEEALCRAYGGLSVAAAVSDPHMLEEALILPKRHSELRVELKNRMSVTVPVFALSDTGVEEGGIYGYAFTSGELDDSVSALEGLLPDLVRMAQLEKEAMLLAEEIERTRRRVNALEHIMMPRYLAAIKRIKMKLDENERGNITRLMKVKDMMLKEALAEKHSFFPDEE
ncbi:MAG: V-type ATP synthase subunit D [Ruminococcaceae bacterium]|nr:V-type ATP synthase subunit D [Oscillospiraceae bacterium]